MGKGRKGRTPDQILKDREEIARLYLQRWTQAEIGRKLGLSRQQVGYDLEAVRQEWLQSSLVNFNALKAEQLARIDRLEAVHWEAWEASKKPRETTLSEQTDGGDGKRVRAQIRKEDQYGDPRFLAGVQACIKQRCDILGLNAPVETRVTGAGGGPVRFTLEDAVAADRELEEWHADRMQTGGGGPPVTGDS